MKKVIDGRVYNTETADCICDLRCSHYPSDFAYHETSLYRTKKGAYFLAGKGGPMSRWRCKVGNGFSGGSGLLLLDYEEARGYAEAADLEPEEMAAAGFAIEEG